MHKINTHFSKIKGVGSASLDRGISIVIASIVLAGIVAGVSWLYNQYTYKKFINDFSMYGIAVREYHKGSALLKGNTSPSVTINLENIKKVKLLPESQDVTKIAKYDFSMLAFNNILLYQIPSSNPSLCRRIVQAINNKEFANKIAYLENQNGTGDRLYENNFTVSADVNTFCSGITSTIIAEYIIRNSL